MEESDLDPDAVSSPSTELFADKSRTVLSSNESPDVPFSQSVNPYRGCEHGCSYCYARPTHEYLDLSAGIDFESKIFVKYDAAKLLKEEISKKSYKPDVICFSGVTDSYQPIERKLQITRACLSVLREFRNPVSIITKNHLITRDVDSLGEMAKDNLSCVLVSVTTLDENIRSRMEPRASTAARRLETIRFLSDHGIPVGVLVAPVIPGLTDHEIPAILKVVKEAGASFAGYVMLRLPHGLKELFLEWLGTNFPNQKKKVTDRILDIRGGTLYDSSFGTRGRGEGAFAEQIQSLFRLSLKKFALNSVGPKLRTDLFEPVQGLLFPDPNKS